MIQNLNEGLAAQGYDLVVLFRGQAVKGSRHIVRSP